MEALEGKILVVDDDEDIRNMVQLVLELEGYQVVTANDGQHALDLIRERGKPALILLDLMMPRMSGEDFLQVREGVPALHDTPVVLLSGHPIVQRIGDVFHADGALVKPVELEELADVARRFVREHGALEPHARRAH